MVLTQNLDSPLVADSDRQFSSDNHHDLKKSTTNLSLKDLLAPVGKESRAFLSVLLSDAYHETEDEDRFHEQFPVPSDDVSIPVIVDQQLLQLRTIRGRGFSDVPQTDTIHGEQVQRLPRFDENFFLPEHSGRLAGSKSTALLSPGLAANKESSKDSSSHPGCAPLLPKAERESRFAWPGEVSKQHSIEVSHKSLPYSLFATEHIDLTMSCPRIQPLPSPRTHQRRSRSIAIKTTQHNASYHQAASASQLDFDTTEENSASNERMYDWATWRMYNRIVDHRRNQRSTLSMSSSRQTVSSQPFSAGHSHYNYNGAMNGPVAATDYIHDGEVFELEI